MQKICPAMQISLIFVKSLIAFAHGVHEQSFWGTFSSKEAQKKNTEADGEVVVAMMGGVDATNATRMALFPRCFLLGRDDCMSACSPTMRLLGCDTVGVTRAAAIVTLQDADVC
jgi:hypothetical protein